MLSTLPPEYKSRAFVPHVFFIRLFPLFDSETVVPPQFFETDWFCTQAETHANAENSLILAVVDNTAPVLRSADSTTAGWILACVRFCPHLV